MAASHYTPEQLARFARRAKMNHDVVLGFGMSILGMMLIFVAYHLIRKMTQMNNSKRMISEQPSFLVSLSRQIRSVTLRKAPGLPSVGHTGLVVVYVAANLAVTFGHLDTTQMFLLSNIASRTGWLAVVNTLVVVFLALKNTPLAYITAWSYERLNILHQIAGYATLAFVIIHAASYSAYFVQANNAKRLFVIEEVYGMVAGVAFLGLALSGAVIRRWWYELFYYSHIAFWMLGIIMTGLHQPEIAKKILYITCAAAGIWVLDRLVRFTRLVIYSINNTVRLTPLAHGATRVSLKKAPVGATAGKHLFLWIPKIRFTQTHPFTLASMDPPEFVVHSRDGFTSALYRYACKNPGVELKASVEGPYGTVPDYTASDKMILVAGGSGATFTFGMALNALKNMAPDDKRKICFIWLIRDKSYLSGFDHHLKILQNDSRVAFKLYVTRASATTVDINSPIVSEAALEKASLSKSSTSKSASDAGLAKISTSVPIVEVQGISPTSSPAISPLDEAKPPIGVDTYPIVYQRPDVNALIRAEVNATAANERVLVMGCGPKGLMKTVRNTTAKCVASDGPAVELHCEEFGW